MNTRKSLIHIIVIATLLFTFGAVAQAAESASHAGPVININTADAGQLALLPRVGPKVAARIVEFREANGPFKKATDLMQVKGIGEKSFETLRPYLVIEGSTTLTEKQKAPRRASQPQPANAAH